MIKTSEKIFSLQQPHPETQRHAATRKHIYGQNGVTRNRIPDGVTTVAVTPIYKRKTESKFALRLVAGEGIEPPAFGL